MKIAIIGTGAIGSLLASALAPENEVTMIGRWREQVDTVGAYGLMHEDLALNRVSRPVRITSDPHRLAGSEDVAIVAVKATRTARAARDALAVLSPEGLAVSLQNGLGNLELLQNELGGARSTVALTSQGAIMRSPGFVRHTGGGLTTIGRLPQLGSNQQDLVSRLCEILNTAGWECTIEDDPELLLWRKLAVNAAINPLTALLGIPNGVLLEQPDWVLLTSEAAAEVARVAAARGIRLQPDQAASIALQVAKDTAENDSSMLQDLRRGVSSEIEAINGQVVAEANRVGVAVPVNETLLALVRGREEGTPYADVFGRLEQLAQSLEGSSAPA